jgi:hypothetical protein
MKSQAEADAFRGPASEEILNALSKCRLVARLAGIGLAAAQRAVEVNAGAAGMLPDLVSNVNAWAQKAQDAYHAESVARYRLARYRIASRMGSREDYLCKIPRHIK